jgi:hypothetical protein
MAEMRLPSMSARCKNIVERNRIDREVEFSEIDRFCNTSAKPFQKSVEGF